MVLSAAFRLEEARLCAWPKMERRKDTNCDLWLHAARPIFLDFASVRDNKHV
jgi:hypothetical protein